LFFASSVSVTASSIFHFVFVFASFAFLTDLALSSPGLCTDTLTP
jgi:hypothetical protein